MNIIERYHGLGNDYLVVDPNKNDIKLTEDTIKLICNRNLGIGSDGILYGPIFKDGSICVKIYNPDGSEAEKSGNGVRIFSRYLLDSGYVTGDKFILSTLGGDVEVEFKDPKGYIIKVSMGKVSFNSTAIPVVGLDREIINESMCFNGAIYNTTCLTIGNPHCVIPMNEISKNIVTQIGPFVENSEFFPNRINLQIMKVIDRNNLEIEIYERGAGYTLASGTSSCAAASAAYKLGLIDNKVTVHMPGGELFIEIQDNFHVTMTGSVNKIGSIMLDAQFIDEIKQCTMHNAQFK